MSIVQNGNWDIDEWVADLGIFGSDYLGGKKGNDV